MVKSADGIDTKQRRLCNHCTSFDRRYPTFGGDQLFKLVITSYNYARQTLMFKHKRRPS